MNEQRIKELETSIKDLRKSYWEGNPQVPDTLYDSVVEELRIFDPGNDLLHEIETAPVTGETITHKKPMLSLNKVYSQDDLFAWIASVSRNDDEKFLIQPKYDGISCHFKNGVYATRGDGNVGQNITNACRELCKFETACDKADFYGEIVIRKSVFDTVYKNIKNGTGKNFKNSRNAVAGILGTDDISFYSKQGATLTLIDYDKNSYAISKKDFDKKWDIFKSVITSLDFPIDGIVIKLADTEYSESLGFTSHHPKGQIAFKFDNQTAVTKLLNIEYGMGREQITATAVFEPIDIGGVTIARAVVPMKSKTLPCIMNGDFRSGTKLVVERAGDVIPHIINVDNSQTGSVFRIDCCPFCGAALSTGHSSVACSNSLCEEKAIQKVIYSLKELGLKNVGESTIRKVSNLIETTSNVSINLYRFLSCFKSSGFFEKVRNLPSFGEQSSKNLFAEVKKIMTTTEEKFIASLCIPNVGTKIATEIMKAMTIDQFLSTSLFERDINLLPGIGDLMADRIVRFINENRAYIIALKELFTFEDRAKNVVKPQGETVCFTGAMNLPRKDMMQIAIKKGFTPVDAVGRGLGMLVVADSERLESSKCKKALSYGVKIIRESDFLSLN